MNAVALTFAILAAVIHIAVFPIESVLLPRYRWAQRFLSTPPGNVDAVMMWAIPVGFRNFVLGAGVVVGIVLLSLGEEAIGTTVTLAMCAVMAISAPAMAVADALGHYPKRGESLPGTVAATVPALIALIASAF